MVKSVLSVNHQGLRDWLIQRVSAILMIIYTIVIFYFLASHTKVDYADWHELFACRWMKIFTIIILISLMYHAWVGIWTILTDYVKPFVLRLFLNVIVLIALAAFFFDGLLILWGV